MDAIVVRHEDVHGSGSGFTESAPPTAHLEEVLGFVQQFPNLTGPGIGRLLQAPSAGLIVLDDETGHGRQPSHPQPERPPESSVFLHA
jgi:hypothetical protein